MDKIKELGTRNFRKKIIPLAASLTLIVFIVSGCSSPLSSNKQQTPNQAQTVLSPLNTSDQTQQSSIPNDQLQSSLPSDQTPLNKKQPSSTQSQTGNVTSKSTTAMVETNADLTQELKTYLKGNFGTTPHEDSWYHYVTNITVAGNKATINTSLNSDKKIANSIANAVHSWPKFMGTIMVKSRSGAILAQGSKK